MKQLLNISSLFLLFILTSATHPFFLSVCEMDYNPESKRLELAIKLFADNITDAVEKSSGVELNIGEKDELETADNELDTYLNKRLKVWVNDKQLSFNFIGKEAIDDVIWCYIESEELSEISNLKVKNQLLTEMFETQKNIVHISVNGKKKSMLLQRGKEEMVVEF